MIELRLGTSWQREGASEPHDSAELLVDGVPLLVRATNERLPAVVGGLLDAVAELFGGARAAQVALEEAHLELCLWRPSGPQLELMVVDLGPTPGLVRAGVRVELVAFKDAVLACARRFAREARTGEPAPEVLQLDRRLAEVSRAVLKPLAPAPGAAVSVRLSPAGGLGVVLVDETGRLASFRRRDRSGLPSLVVPGALVLPDGTEVTGFPWLMLLGLTRAALEGPVTLAGRTVDRRAVLETGLHLPLTLAQLFPGQGANPWVETMRLKCTEGLAALRAPSPSARAPAPAPSAPRAPAQGPAVEAPGELRRLRLVPAWSRDATLGESGARLLLLRRGVVAATSKHAAELFTKTGKQQARRVGARGVAVLPSGHSVVATPERLLGFGPRGGSASWLQPWSGAAIGPAALEAGGRWVVALSGRGLLCVDPLTGREAWRVDPPRALTGHAAALGGLLVLGTDGGDLYGVDAHDGQVRFRLKTALPLSAPAVPFKGKGLAVLARGDHTAVVSFDVAPPRPHAPPGSVVWSRELLLSTPCPPLLAGGQVFVGGGRDGEAWVTCLSASGAVRWEARVPCDARTLSLVAWAGGVIAGDARGVCVRLLSTGERDWVLGAGGGDFPHRVPLFLRKKLLVVPGPTVRLVEPQTGRALGGVEVGPDVVDVAADTSLRVYVLHDTHRLEAFKPGPVLSVVTD